MLDLGEYLIGHEVRNSADWRSNAQGTGEASFGRKSDQRRGGKSPLFKLNTDGLEKLLVERSQVAPSGLHLEVQN